MFLRSRPHLLPAATLALTLAAAVGAAWAEPVAPAGPLAGGPGGFERVCRDHDARLAARLAYAEVKLKLDEPQKAEFRRLSESLAAAQAPMTKLCGGAPAAAPTAAAPTAPVPLPERLSRMQTLSEAHAESLRQSVPALLRFYQTLSPEQKAVADQVLVVGPGGHGPKGGPKGGPDGGRPGGGCMMGR